MKVRLFVALKIPDETLNRIIELRDSSYGYNKHIKWEKRDKLHITLKFLGETEKEKIADILTILEDAANKYNSFEISFNKFGLFYYKRTTPKILWIGAEDDKYLNKLQAEIEEKLAGLGFDKDPRSFNSHLTLLRVKGNEDRDKLEKFGKVEFKPIKFTAQKILLIQSELKPEGSVYTIIKSFEMKKTED